MVTFAEFKTWFLPQFLISYAFIVSGLIVNFFELLVFIFVRPFDRILSKRITHYLAYTLHSNITSLATWWSGTELIIYINDDDFKMLGKENCFCVLNHKYDIDWILGWVLCQKLNLLGGSKVVLKDSLKYIPILGWSWSFSEYVFVKRVWDTDHKVLVRDLKAILEFPKDLNYSISIFCEGTRWTKEKYEESMKVAIKKGLPILKYHLLPRTKGFNLMASQLAGHIDYLYDITLGVEDVNGRQPGISEIKNGIPLRAHLFIRRIPMSKVPSQDDQKCSEFVQKLYQEKDDIFDAFYRNSNFDSLGVKRQIIKENKKDLYISIFWLISILVPSGYYLFYLLWNGSWMFKIMFAVSIISVNLFMNWLIGRSQVKNASTFGLPTPPPTPPGKKIY